MLVAATACWSLSFPTMKALGLMQQGVLPEASTWFTAALCMAYRFGIATAVMAVWCAPTLHRLTRSELWEGIGLAAFASGGLVFQMDGLAYTSASTSAFLTQCYCLIIPLWIAVRERRWPRPVMVASCLMVIAGVTILSKVDWRHFRLGRGEVETLVASLIFTGQILWLERPRFARNSVRHFTLVMFGMICAFCLPLAWATAHRPADLWHAYATPPPLIALGVLVLFSTLGGYLLMNRWQPRVTATEAGLIYCVEPVFASVVAFFMPGWYSRWAGVNYPNEHVASNLVIGGGLITVANMLIQLRPTGAPGKGAVGSDE